ncbi:phage holin family protein, partial [Pseudomonas aeruginosa]
PTAEAKPEPVARAEIAVGLYERWAARRLGVCELPEEQSDDRGPH